MSMPRELLEGRCCDAGPRVPAMVACAVYAVYAATWSTLQRGRSCNKCSVRGVVRRVCSVVLRTAPCFYRRILLAAAVRAEVYAEAGGAVGWVVGGSVTASARGAAIGAAAVHTAAPGSAQRHALCACTMDQTSSAARCRQWRPARAHTMREQCKMMSRYGARESVTSTEEKTLTRVRVRALTWPNDTAVVPITAEFKNVPPRRGAVETRNKISGPVRHSEHAKP